MSKNFGAVKDIYLGIREELYSKYRIPFMTTDIFHENLSLM